MANFCDQCGEKQDNNGLFCANCGNKIAFATVSANQTSNNAISQIAVGSTQESTITKANFPHIRIVALLVLATLLSMFVFLGLFNIAESKDKKQIISVVKQLETSYNQGDIQGILDCLDPSISNGVTAAFNFAGKFLGIKFRDLIDFIPFLYSITDGSYAPKIKLDIDNVIITDTNAVVEARVIFNSESLNIRISMQDKNGKWYITNIK